MPTLPLRRFRALPFLVAGTLLLSACGSDEPAPDDDPTENAEENPESEEPEEEDAGEELLADAETFPIESLGLSVSVPEGWAVKDEGLEYGDTGVIAQDETSLVVMGEFDGVMEPPEAGLALPDLATHGVTAIVDFYYSDGATRTSINDEDWELDGHPGYMVEEELTPPEPGGLEGIIQFLAIDRGDADPMFAILICEPGNDDRLDQAIAIRDSISFD